MQSDRPKQNKPPVAGNTERILEIRRQRRLRKLRATVVCVVLTAMIFSYFMGAFGTPLALLGDAVDSVKIALMPAAGFPVELSQTGYATSMPLAGGFAVMGTRELSLYSAHGNFLRRVPHGYARPCITAGDSRVCMYSRGDTTLSVESRTRNLFTHTFREPILLAEMSGNGTLAVFTKTTLEVFDPLFESIWAWKNSNEIPLAMAFAEDNKHLAVATVLATGGGIGTVLHFFNMRSDTEQTTATVGGGVPVRMRHFGSKLLVVFDTFTALYDAKDGKELAHYPYGARLLQGASVDEAGRVALLFGDAQSPGITTAIVLDSSLQETATIFVGRAARTISLANRAVHILTSDSVLVYGLDGVQTRTVETQTKPLAVLAARKTLLVTADAAYPIEAKDSTDGTQSSATAQPNGTDGASQSGSGGASSEAVSVLSALAPDGEVPPDSAADSNVTKG